MSKLTEAILLSGILITTMLIGFSIADSDGQAPTPDNATNSSRNTTCIYCGDTGCVADAHDCEQCGASGYVKCPICLGYKSYINPEWVCDHAPDCSDPDPSGQPRMLQCTACNENGEVVCPKCLGKGYWVSYINCQFCGKTCQSSSN